MGRDALVVNERARRKNASLMSDPLFRRVGLLEPLKSLPPFVRTLT